MTVMGQPGTHWGDHNSWGTTACPNHIPYLEHPMEHTTTQSKHFQLSFFCSCICTWVVPTKALNQLWVQSTRRGFNTIISILCMFYRSGAVLQQSFSSLQRKLVSFCISSLQNTWKFQTWKSSALLSSVKFETSHFPFTFHLWYRFI